MFKIQEELVEEGVQILGEELILESFAEAGEQPGAPDIRRHFLGMKHDTWTQGKEIFIYCIIIFDQIRLYTDYITVLFSYGIHLSESVRFYTKTTFCCFSLHFRRCIVTALCPSF